MRAYVFSGAQGLVPALAPAPVPEDTGLGYMEFFDWLAGKSNQELIDLAKERGLFGFTAYTPEMMTPLERENAALAVWAAL